MIGASKRLSFWNSGLKGRAMIAQGEALGKLGQRKLIALQGRADHASAPLQGYIHSPFAFPQDFVLGYRSAAFQASRQTVRMPDPSEYLRVTGFVRVTGPRGRGE